MSRFITAVFIFIFLNAPLLQAAPDHHVVIITVDGFPAYLLHDPLTPIPTIRQLAAEGVVSEGMRVSNPTITWPNHTTLVTGVYADKHSVLFNGIMARPGPGLPVRLDGRKDKSELVAVPTQFDFFHKEGFRTAAINWPCTRNSGTLDDDFPDVPENILHTTLRLKNDLVAQKILSDTNEARFRSFSGPARDDVWTQAACHVIRERKPHLLLFHLLNTDSTHHRYGPNSPAGGTALALADRQIREVVRALEDAGIRPKTTLLILSDHGFAPATNILFPNVLLRQAGLIEVGETNQIVKARAQFYSSGGSGMIYLNNPETADADRKKVLEIFKDREGIAEIIQPGDFAKLGLPSPEKNRGMGDMILVAKDGYALLSTAGDEFILPVTHKSNLGFHGCMASNPKMNAIFLATGRGIKRGVKIGLINNVDVAPTAAHLLGKKFGGADGKVLTEILGEP